VGIMDFISNALEVLQKCINSIHSDYHRTGSSTGSTLELESGGAQFYSPPVNDYRKYKFSESLSLSPARQMPR
jgi:hypothetical protein